jgi:hypothetical protein
VGTKTKFFGDKKMGNGLKIHGVIGAAIISSVALFSVVQPASADSLHVFCSSPTPTCTDNGSITPTSSNPPTFGFLKDGGADADAGTLYLEVLIPNDVANAASEAFSISGTYTGNALVNASLISTTAWTSGQLDAYLGISASPTNPIGAFLPLTQGYDAGAGGYYVYNFNFGAVDFGQDNPLFTVNSALPIGTIVTAFFDTTVCHGPNCSEDWVATPNSAALILTDGTPPPLPEPATLSLLGAGLVGLRYLRRKRETR